jgi:rare lipoprotein A
MILKGKASYYGAKFHGRQTANGEVYNMYALTAAHKSLPFGTRIIVTNLQNHKTVTVKINDRGPFIDGRILDLSYQAAKEISMLNEGVADITIKIIRLGKE